QHDRIEFGRDFNPFITGLCCRGCRWHSSTSLYNNAGGWLWFGPFGHACLLRVGHRNDLGRPLEPWLFKILAGVGESIVVGQSVVLVAFYCSHHDIAWVL